MSDPDWEYEWLLLAVAFFTGFVLASGGSILYYDHFTAKERYVTCMRETEGNYPEYCIDL